MQTKTPDTLRALVTGASAGLGQAIARRLAARGFALAILSRRQEALDGLAQELRELGAPEVRTLAIDLADHAALRARVAALVDDFGPVHVLVNNTGGPPAGPAIETRIEDLRAAMDTLLYAPHILVQTLLPGMETEGYGRIITVASISLREPMPGMCISNAARGAIGGWTKSLSLELPPFITANTVLPGYTRTQRVDNVAQKLAADRGVSPDEVVEGWVAGIPAGRLGEPEELGELVAFLASPEGAYIRGAAIPVDGGWLRGI